MGTMTKTIDQLKDDCIEALEAMLDQYYDAQGMKRLRRLKKAQEAIRDTLVVDKLKEDACRQVREQNKWGITIT